jgi:hypothetical protein
MHEEFAGWYASLSLGEDTAQVEGRWKAVDALVKEASKTTLELLVRLVFRMKPQQMSAPDVATLRAKFAGETTPPGDEELVVLAGAALACAMRPTDDNSVLAATMVAAAACGGLRKLELPMDLIGISDRANRVNAETSRRRPPLDVGKPVATALDKAEVALAVKHATDGNPAAGIQALANSIGKVIVTVARRQAAVEEAFQNYTRLQDEELDLLWWLQGSYSSGLEKDFNDIPHAHRPLGIARELAALTKVLPGPTALHALLTRTGVAEAPKMTIVAAVQGMPGNWLDASIEDLEGENITALTTPILFALSRRKELEGAEGWATAWSKLTLLDEGAELEPMDLAEAAYREFILARLG